MKNDFKQTEDKYMCLFASSNANLFWGLMQSYLNSMKLACQTLLSSNFWAWPWNSEIIWKKKKEKFESKTGQKGHEFSKQKGPQSMQNFLHEGK